MTPRSAAWLLAALLALPACSDSGSKPQGAPATAVSAITAAVAPMKTELDASGTVEPSATVAVKSLVDGQVKSVLFNEGDLVAEGQPLFQIDDTMIRAQIAAAEAARDRDAASANQLTAEYERIQKLAGKGFESASALDAAKAAADAATFAAEADQAQIDELNVQLAYYAIAAPVAGRTGESTLRPGATIKANDTASLVTINRLSPVRVRFSIPAASAALARAHLGAGDAAVLAAPHGATGTAETGKLVFLDNAVDAANGQLLAKGEFANTDESLLPGALVDVTLDLGTAAELVALPEAAVQLGADKPYVFIAAAGDVAQKRQVEIAGRNDGQVFLNSGVNAGERVIVDGLAKLSDGAKVAVHDVTPAPAAAPGAGAAGAPLASAP
ncbi:Multidrug resistance protein MdtA [Alphaproteobacteria bacterium SO-S41]|nr:Multidrug resistance protein MdtA [Alphaproteobacteria bacterium SO-S41]